MTEVAGLIDRIKSLAAERQERSTWGCSVI
jgi:hypothetical protein